MAVSGKSRTFAPSKHRKFQKLKDNKPSRRAARQHTWRAFFILGGRGIFVHYRFFLTCSAADASGFHRWRCAPARPWCGWLRLPPWIFLPLLLTVVKSHDSAIQASLMALGLASVGFSYPNNCFRTRKTYVLEWKRSIRLVMSQICYICGKIKEETGQGTGQCPASSIFFKHLRLYFWIFLRDSDLPLYQKILL